MLSKLIDKIVRSRIDGLRAELEEKIDIKVSKKVSQLEASFNTKFTEVDKKILSVKDLRDITSKNLSNLRERIIQAASEIKKALD